MSRTILPLEFPNSTDLPEEGVFVILVLFLVSWVVLELIVREPANSGVKPPSNGPSQPTASGDLLALGNAIGKATADRDVTVVTSVR